MRKAIALLILIAATTAWSQSGSNAQAAPAAKSGTAAKPAATAHTAPSKPTAIINTTVGKMTCTLFPDKAPIGVENFIGLASGTKDWKNPISGATKHGVPLYDGTIFHRVIPEFMIQGGDPAGGAAARATRCRNSRTKFRRTCCSTSRAGLPMPTPAPTRTVRSSSSPRYPRRI